MTVEVVVTALKVVVVGSRTSNGYDGGHGGEDIIYDREVVVVV